MTFTEYKRDLLQSIDTEKREDDNGLSYEAFSEIPPRLKVTKKDIGNKVWIASYPRTTECSVVNVNDDGVRVKFKGEVPLRWFYHDEVMIHLDLWSKKRLDFSVELSSKFT